jgi:aminopeptidase N
MGESQVQTIYRHDYRQPDYWIDSIDLRFELEEEKTQVYAKIEIRRHSDRDGKTPLVLDGIDLKLRSIKIDGAAITAPRYQIDAESLQIHDLPATFILETEVEIAPQDNTSLEGLYKAGGIFCTQCEAQGFRKITYFPDRPDVMTHFTTTIVGDASRYPVMLSNGNPVESGKTPDGRSWITWRDPFKKPSYLFALVAGDLQVIEDKFQTKSGRDILLQIFVEEENITKCDHAMLSLKQAMKWDEETFGLEYDLDIYMIVAVNDFNMGAMENKGLNVFNSKYVLARQDTATDADFAGIQGVIGHEYFHNWSGNRVTCRDWFQLSLKEGLTVFRDQEFSSDMNSRAVCRIEDVNVLRTLQFSEDNGPMSHCVRPDSYMEINNFYTRTIYEKGSEIVRMIQTLLGVQGFNDGLALYFKRHDGQAVTCDDFVQAMADANDHNLDDFKRWYSQSGTPLVRAKMDYDSQAQTATFEISQTHPPTANQKDKEPLLIPIRMALLDPQNGQAMPLFLKETKKDAASEATLELSDETQSFTFYHVSQKPIPSLFRQFSSPVSLEYDYKNDDLAFLLAHDTDAFARWEAGQKLGISILKKMMQEGEVNDCKQDAKLLIQSFGELLQGNQLEPALIAVSLRLPSEHYLAQQMRVIEVERIHEARETLKKWIAGGLRELMLDHYQRLDDQGPYHFDAKSVGRRSLKNILLSYLMVLDDAQIVTLCFSQYEGQHNMTDVIAALSALTHTTHKHREEALDHFYKTWQHDALVCDKWFALQALSNRQDTLERVNELISHPAFEFKNPNRVRSLVDVFCNHNTVRFHDIGGGGYRFLSENVQKLDSINPQVAARSVRALSNWRRFDETRQNLMKEELEKIAGLAKVSKHVYEIAAKSLK